MYTGAVASTAARYSTAQGSATAAARRSTAATLRSADAREGRSGELPRKRREDVAEGWTRAARGILPIAGRRWPGRRGAGPGTDSSARASDGMRSQSLSLTVAGGAKRPGSETGLRRRKVVTAKAETALP